MNANELYEKLQQIGKPLVHVESLVSTMQLEIRWCIKKYAKKKQVEF